MISSITIPKLSGNFVIDGSNCLLMTLDGVGNPLTKITKIDYPTRNGGKIISQYYEKRRIKIGGAIFGSTIEDFMQLRQELGDAFSFNGVEKTIKITTSEPIDVQFNGIAVSELRMNQEAGVVNSCDWEIELELQDPLFYSQSSTTSILYKAIVTGGFAIPTAIPISFSGGLTNLLSIINSGNAYITPNSVRIYGPGTGFAINNNTTNETLTFNGTLVAGDYVDLNFELKTAYKNSTTDVYGDMSGNWWTLKPGTNLIILNISSGDDANSRVEIITKSGYINI